MSAKRRKAGNQNLATNRRAKFDYELLDRFEAGIVLTGTEIKSARNHGVNLQRSFVIPRNGELWLIEAHISPYDNA